MAGMPARCPNPGPKPPRTRSLNFGKGASARPAGNELASNESYQMVNSILEICDVSEHQAEAIQGETGSVGIGSSEAPSERAADIAVSVLESPAIAPDHEAPKVEAPKVEVPKADASKIEASKVEMMKTVAPRTAAKLMIMAPGDRTWHDHSAGAEVKSETRTAAPAAAPSAAKSETTKRSFPAMAAMLALATVAGAIGGALATSGLTHVADAAATTPASGALEASIARIDADMVALKAGLEHTSKQGATQFNKTTDRLDKIEKAQAEPAAKLAKLTEAVDKLRAAPVPAAVAAAPAGAPAATKEVTGSVTAPQTVATAAPATTPVIITPKPEVARLPNVEGWSLADVGYGGALIRNRRGTFEVYTGDYVPGLGRIDAIRKQDGQWVVVTSKGLITR
jgi:hypothetical protein